MLRTAPVTQLDNRAKRGHRFCFLGFLFPQMRELESSIPDTLQVFFLTVGGFFLNKELKLNDSSCQTKVWVGGWGEGRINTVLLLGTRDRLKGVTQREVAPEGGNPSLFFGGGKSRILILFVVICSCAVVWLHTCFFHCVVANKPELKLKKQRKKRRYPGVHMEHSLVTAVMNPWVRGAGRNKEWGGGGTASESWMGVTPWSSTQGTPHEPHFTAHSQCHMVVCQDRGEIRGLDGERSTMTAGWVRSHQQIPIYLPTKTNRSCDSSFHWHSPFLLRCCSNVALVCAAEPPHISHVGSHSLPWSVSFEF